MDLHDDGRVAVAKPFGEDDASLGKALVVALQTGENEIEALVAHRRRERIGRVERIGGDRAAVLDVDGAVGTARQCLAQHLRDAFGSDGAHDDLAAVRLLEAQRLFEGIRVRLVHLVGDVGITNPGARVVDARLPVASWNLFDADGDFHGAQLRGPVAVPAAGRGAPRPFPTAYP